MLFKLGSTENGIPKYLTTSLGLAQFQRFLTNQSSESCFHPKIVDLDGAILDLEALQKKIQPPNGIVKIFLNQT